MTPMDEVQNSLALSGLAYICIVLIAIFGSWWALQQFRFDLFVRNPRSAPAKVLQVLLSIALGYQVARFIIDYFNWTQLLQGLF
ncbi:DUF1146 family protein [Paenibacillus koleovorans]|uniref:DUF1146 family protein n=1 Tax=Paenibacillus koleovorans TaxID=121608 RepID=UPI000FD6BEA6|nr:DUF1146 family protein [Paenibacillus koleovorans]